MYALGRELEDADDCPVRDITAGLQASDYRFGPGAGDREELPVPISQNDRMPVCR